MPLLLTAVFAYALIVFCPVAVRSSLAEQAAGAPASFEKPRGTSSERFVFFPEDEIYPPYTADPFRIGFGIQWMNVSKEQVPDTGTTRLGLRIGAQFGIMRFINTESPDQRWQLGFSGGFNAQNDFRHSLDNIGWDGRYGALFTATASRAYAFKAGLMHDSSHVGDEYIERTGRRRIGYTREEVLAGVSRLFLDRWRVYGEYGWGYGLRNHSLQKPGRAEAGIEFESSSFLRSGPGWYAALDVSAMQERDWRWDVSVQAGRILRNGSGVWRIGLEWYEGRPPVGEFFQDTERYLSFGVWIDK